VQKIVILLRLKLLCTINTPLNDELRTNIKKAEANICGNIKIEVPVQQGQCHNFVKAKTEATLRFLVGKIQCHEFELAHYETVILDLASGNFHFIESVVNMSIRSSELNDEVLGERYANRTDDDDDPFNPNANAVAATHSSNESLFGNGSDGDNDNNFDINDGLQEPEGTSIPHQERETVPRAREPTATHGHATRATTRVRTPAREEPSVASSRTPKTNAVPPLPFSPPAHNPPPNTVFARRQTAGSPSQINYGQFAPSRDGNAHVG
jgi:hypothetical protein